MERRPETFHLDQDRRADPELNRKTYATSQRRSTLAGCATATAKTFGSRSLAGRWGRSPTQVALGNAAGRLPRGKPDEGEPHVRFGKGEQETGFAPAPAPHFTEGVLTCWFARNTRRNVVTNGLDVRVICR